MKKRILSLMILSSLLISCNETKEPIIDTEQDNKVQVVLMLGQSNMEGHTHSQYLIKTKGETKAKEYAIGFSDIQIAYRCSINFNDSNGEFVDVKLGQGTNIERFGPEIGIAETLHGNKFDGKVMLVKFAQGATSLYNQWMSPSSGRSGQLYSAMLEYFSMCMDNLENLGYYPELKAICWMQGEDDSSSSEYYKYETLEENFINDLRNDLAYYSSSEGIYFIDAGISDCSAWTHHQEVNQAKLNNSNKSDLNIYFSTIENGLKYNLEPVGAPDIYHYDSDSMIKLGNLFGERLLTILK